MKFGSIPQTFQHFSLGSGLRFHYEILYQKIMLYILKIPTKLSIVPQSFCQNVNSDHDQDHIE